MSLKLKLLSLLFFTSLFGLAFLFHFKTEVRAEAANVNVYVHSNSTIISSATVTLNLGPLDPGNFCNYAGKNSSWTGTFTGFNVYVFYNGTNQLDICCNLQSYTLAVVAPGYNTVFRDVYSSIHGTNGSTVTIDVDMTPSYPYPYPYPTPYLSPPGSESLTDEIICISSKTQVRFYYNVNQDAAIIVSDDPGMNNHLAFQMVNGSGSWDWTPPSTGKFYAQLNRYGFFGDQLTFTISSLSCGTPGTPTGLSVSVPCSNTSYGSSLNFTWNASSGATGYQIMVSTDINFGGYVSKTVTTNSASGSGGWSAFNWSNPPISSGNLNLNPNTTYYWRVRASNKNGFSAWSLVSSFNAPSCPSNGTLNIRVFNDNGTGAGNGFLDSDESLVSDLVTQGMNVRLDSTTAPKITSSMVSLSVSSGNHSLYISPLKGDPSDPLVDQTTVAWVVTQWNIGNSPISGTRVYSDQGGNPKNFLAQPISITSGLTTNVFLGVRRINFNIFPNSLPKPYLNPQSDSEDIIINLTWSNGWAPTTIYSADSNCADVNSDSNQFTATLGTNICNGGGGTTTTGTITKSNNAVTVTMTVATTALGVGALPSTTFTVRGTSISDVQGITLTPSTSITIQFGFGPWLKTTKGNVGSRSDISMDATAPSGQKNAEKLVIATSSITNFSSVKNWLVKSYPPSGLSLPPGPHDYQTFFSRFSNVCLESGNSFNSVQRGLHRFVGDITWKTGTSFGPCGTSGRNAAVIFIQGNFTVSDSASHSFIPNLPTVFIVSGNITIDPAITNIRNAVLLSDGSFDDSLGNQALTIDGSVMGSLALNSASLRLRRDLGANNSITPAETINFDPQYYWLLAEYIGVPRTRTVEQAPE